MKFSWMRTGLWVAAGLWLSAASALGAGNTASTQGACSPAFAQVEVHGNLIINATCANYHQELQPIADTLNALRRENKLNAAQMRAMLDASNIMVGAILKRLDKLDTMATDISDIKQSLRNVPPLIQQLPKSGNAPERIVSDAQQWKERYDKLLEQWQQVSGEGELDRQARQALLDLNLDKAGRLLDQLIQQSEPMEKTVALRHYRRAEVFRLQFRPLDALPHYKAAYALDSENPEFGFAYALLLQDQNDFVEAERVYVPLLATLRKLATDHPADYRPDVAMALNNLANLYGATQRVEQAEAAYIEALDIDRALARDNPAAYRPDLAMTLNDLANLYAATQRVKQAEAANLEALAILRALARDNPEAYRPDVARTLNNLAALYGDTKRFEQAEAAFVEALDIDRALAHDNPAAYRPAVATTLDNLATLYRATRRFKQAEAADLEALAILRALARDNPAAYRPDLASTLNNLGKLYRSEQRIKDAEALELEAKTLTME